MFTISILSFEFISSEKGRISTVLFTAASRLPWSLKKIKKFVNNGNYALL